jgi:ATP-binding cassette subfamily F protein 3
MTTEEVRGLLGRFLFSGDTVFKKVGDISGGEKARLALAKMLMQPVNFLILDEPTNHLDIPAKEMLESALKEYEGSVVIVSHDRYFISQVATKIVEVRDCELRVYAGDYNYYLSKIEEEKREAQHATQMTADRQEHNMVLQVISRQQDQLDRHQSEIRGLRIETRQMLNYLLNEKDTDDEEET